MISILIPIYNGIEFIEESVTSVINQTNSNWELIIGINGHSENSDIYKKAKEYENKSDKIKVLDFFNIKGKSNTLNEMINFCSYDFIALLDVDDIWHPKKLEIQTINNNMTRFVIINKENNFVSKDEINRASIKFELDHKRGSLAAVLNVMSDCKLNLTKIQSLPKIETPWKYSFFVDVTFEKYEDYAKAKSLLEIMAEYFKVLGEYKNTRP